MGRSPVATIDESGVAESILGLYGEFCSALITGQRDAWLFVDLTMPQIKALFLVVKWGSATGSRLAKGLGVGLPSVTRLVDRLQERGLIVREEAADDRRVTHTRPTAAGRQVIEDLLSYRREYLGAALRTLSVRELQQVECGLSHLLAACRRQEAG
jgi:DNA-binding MarR family transcriptional regulator